MTPPKSPMPKSPMLKSPMPKSPMEFQKYETGCMWHLYGLFNFRQGHSNKKLLSDKKHVKRLDDGSLKTKLDLLSKMDEKRRSTDDRMMNKTQTVDSDMASKRKLKGEELSTELQMNKKIAIDEVKHMQSSSELFGHSPKNNGKARNTRQRSYDITLHSLKNETKNQRPSNSIPVEKPSMKLKSAALTRVFSKEVHSNAAEAIISQKFIDGMNHQPKQLLDALKILNSNKELFIKLLQDPNSVLVRHIEDLRESQTRKHQSKSRQSEGRSSTHKLKSCDIYPSQETGDFEISERIVNLKPGLPNLQNSADSSSERRANFSFSRIKKKLRHAIGVSSNEQHSNSIDGTPHISHCQGSDYDCNGKGVETIRRTSSSISHADSGGVTKSSFDIEKRDNIGKVKEFDSSIGHEAASTSGSGLGNSNISLVSQPRRKESETSVEDRNHLLELLKNGNKDKNYFESQAQETLGRVTSFPECNFLPTEEEYFKISRQPLTSSPDVLTPTPSSIQRVEDSDGIGDRGEQPSPTASSPASTISKPAEEHHFAPLGRSALDPETSSLNKREYISDYVTGVLQASGLNWDELAMMCHSSDQLLDPFLFNAVKLQANQFHVDCMLLFGCINEVLVEVYQTHVPCSPWVSFIKPNVTRQLCIEKTVIHEVMKYVDWHLLLHPSPRTMQQIVEKDIARSGMWLDIRNDAEEIVVEMVEDILEELIMETIF